MATAPLRYCTMPGCHTRVTTGRCDQHVKDSASARGYGRKWQRYTQWYRDEQIRQGVPRAGLCGSRLRGATLTTDSTCAAQGLITLGRVVDHIRPATGPDDPTFYDPLNHQLLCDGMTGRGCHDRKRQREGQRW
jgi:5-methylcytosine-specific restriction protein A